MRSACLSYFLECINIRSSIASVGSARRSLVRCSEQRERWRRPPKVVAIGFEEVRRTTCRNSEFEKMAIFYFLV